MFGFPTPIRTNVCSLFWRTVFLTPVAIAMSPAAAVLGGILAPVAGVFVLLHDYKGFRSEALADATDLAFDWVAAKKNRVCPIVEIT